MYSPRDLFKRSRSFHPLPAAAEAANAAANAVNEYECGQGTNDVRQKASVVMQRLFYPTETVSSKKIHRNRTVLSLKDSPRKPLRRRLIESLEECEGRQ